MRGLGLPLQPSFGCLASAEPETLGKFLEVRDSATHRLVAIHFCFRVKAEAQLEGGNINVGNTTPPSTPLAAVRGIGRADDQRSRTFDAAPVAVRIANPLAHPVWATPTWLGMRCLRNGQNAVTQIGELRRIPLNKAAVCGNVTKSTNRNGVRQTVCAKIGGTTTDGCSRGGCGPDASKSGSARSARGVIPGRCRGRGPRRDARASPTWLVRGSAGQGLAMVGRVAVDRASPTWLVPGSAGQGLAMVGRVTVDRALGGSGHSHQDATL